jgi:hypothetical protein
MRGCRVQAASLQLTHRAVPDLLQVCVCVCGEGLCWLLGLLAQHDTLQPRLMASRAHAHAHKRPETPAHAHTHLGLNGAWAWLLPQRTQS